MATKGQHRCIDRTGRAALLESAGHQRRIIKAGHEFALCISENNGTFQTNLHLPIIRMHLEMVKVHFPGKILYCGLMCVFCK